MYNAVVHQLQKDAKPVPEQWFSPSTNSCQYYSFHTMSCGTEYPFNMFRSAVLVLTPQILVPPQYSYWQDSTEYRELNLNLVLHCLATSVCYCFSPEAKI